MYHFLCTRFGPGSSSLLSSLLPPLSSHSATGFATIVETMASSDDDSAYTEEASNEDDEVNDENLDPNKNSSLHFTQ
jgi:hypothetical protein